ncbi:MAG: S41 family peptidase [Alphaproteobacteria bacterium]
MKYSLRVLLLSSCLSLLGGMFFCPSSGHAQPPGKEIEKAKNQDTYEYLNLFGDVFERVRSEYVEPVEDKKLIEAAINGMLTSLDPHSSYMDKESFSDMQVQTRGEFGGLGIEVTLQDGVVKVVSPIDDTPAAKAGLQSGDLIVQLDDQPVVGLSLNDAVKKMRGPIGTPIRLLIRRGETEPFEVSLVRDQIKVRSVRSKLEDNDVGYIRITSFNEQTQPGLDKALNELETQSGGKLVGYVLDLRNNPGGLLDQAVSVSDTFLDFGEIVSTRGRAPRDGQHWQATKGDKAKGRPIIVLINGGSASASEIVAGALQDHRRAIVLGQQSFGKGSVQTVMEMHGSGAMRLTTQRYYTPSGRSIQAEGIKPDIEVKPAKVEELTPGRSYSEKDLLGALENPDHPKAKEAAKDKKAEDAITKDKKEEKSAPTKDDKNNKDDKSTGKKSEETPFDYQLSRAKDLLHGLALFTGKQEEKPVGLTPETDKKAGSIDNTKPPERGDKKPEQDDKKTDEKSGEKPHNQETKPVKPAKPD